MPVKSYVQVGLLSLLLPISVTGACAGDSSTGERSDEPGSTTDSSEETEAGNKSGNGGDAGGTNGSGSGTPPPLTPAPGGKVSDCPAYVVGNDLSVCTMTYLVDQADHDSVVGDFGVSVLSSDASEILWEAHEFKTAPQLVDVGTQGMVAVGHGNLAPVSQMDPSIIVGQSHWRRYSARLGRTFKIIGSVHDPGPPVIATEGRTSKRALSEKDTDRGFCLGPSCG